MAATANSSYTFEITGSEVLATHPKSGLHTIVVEGICTNADGVSFDFLATNNLDMRYADRFKVNWNGNKARMPEVVGHGLDDDRKAGRKVSENLYFTRGARIAIARKCAALFPTWKQQGLEEEPAASE
jgi:hypothetical protein|tara:strand:+ start:274 stop:657 length:384 start_codon:yes stop_codon:yes gene_type:complete